MQLGIHHRHGAARNLSMTEVAFRPSADWESAMNLSWGEPFWDEAASHLQALPVFKEDPRNSKGISGIDLSTAIDDVIEALAKVQHNDTSDSTSLRFTGQQLLVILSFQFNIPVMAPHFSQNWNEWTTDDLTELAFFLQLSEVCGEFEGSITIFSVRAWLEDLGWVFGQDWQSVTNDEEDCGSSDWQSARSVTGDEQHSGSSDSNSEADDRGDRGDLGWPSTFFYEQDNGAQLPSILLED
jgi:hypothetical protein